MDNGHGGVSCSPTNDINICMCSYFVQRRQSANYTATVHVGTRGIILKIVITAAQQRGTFATLKRMRDGFFIYFFDPSTPHRTPQTRATAHGSGHQFQRRTVD